MLKKIDHIGIAVSDLDTACKKYESLTGKSAGDKETVASQKVETSFFPVGDVRLELLKGTAEDSPIYKFLEKRGPGVHHICFEVEDLASAQQAFTAAGLEFIKMDSDEGAGGTRVAFMHPKSTGGVLFELVEYEK